MKNYFFVCCFLVTLFSRNCWAQISPPGLGTAHTADWFAFGIRQELDSLKAWTSISYFGLGRKSNPDNYDLLFKSGILVFNQEFYHQFHPRWQYSFALSYRRQDEYHTNPPYESDQPKLKQEYRLYGRFSYLLTTAMIKFVPTFRTEGRKFFAPDFSNLTENFQFRMRFRLQLTVNLNVDKSHRLIAGSEQLFSISEETSSPEHWSNFDYRESRFSLYYSYSFDPLPFIINLGYMNNLVGSESVYDVHYLALDFVWENPFKRRQRTQENINKN